MSKKSVTIELDDKIVAKLEKRAKKNIMSLRELIQDIVRRSAASSKFTIISGETDDRLVEIFSRKAHSIGHRKRRKG